MLSMLAYAIPPAAAAAPGAGDPGYPADTQLLDVLTSLLLHGLAGSGQPGGVT